MPTALTPFGMYPRKSLGSRRHTAGATQFNITVDPAAAIYYGAPVTLIGGSVKAIATSPTTTPGATSPVGVLQGAFWDGGALSVGSPFHPFVPAAILAGGARRATCLINDDPDLWFLIQANGTLDLTAQGKNAALVNPGAGNATTGRSTCALDAASVANTITLAVKIIRVLQPGDAYPECLVQWNAGVHQYNNGYSASTFETDDESLEHQWGAEGVEDRKKKVEESIKVAKEREKAEKEREKKKATRNKAKAEEAVEELDKADKENEKEQPVPPPSRQPNPKGKE